MFIATFVLFLSDLFLFLGSDLHNNISVIDFRYESLNLVEKKDIKCQKMGVADRI